MKKAIAILAAAAVAAMSADIWYHDGTERHTNVIPYSKIKDKEFSFGLWCQKPDGEPHKIKVVVEQTNPCFINYDLDVKKINDHTVEVYDNGYFAVGAEMTIDPSINGEVVLGDRKCEEHYKDKETWTIYHYVNGKWKYGCKGTFIFK